MVSRRFGSFVAAVLVAIGGGMACQARPAPETLFAEAEALRPKYTTETSRRAIANYHEAMRAWERRGLKQQAATAGQQLGATYEQLGLLQESLAAYQAALRLARESSDRTLESDILSDVGIAQSLVANREEVFEEARRHCEMALELARQAGGQRGVGKALTCLGEVSYYRKQPAPALEYYRKAAEVWDRLNDQRGQARTLLAQGTVYSDLREFDQAQHHYDRARPLWTSLGDRRGQAIARVADARLHVRRGAYQEALNEFERALALLEPTGDAVWQASSLTGIARVYLDMAEWSSALEHWERALRLFERAGLHSIAVDVLGSLGETYLVSGDDTKALDRFERALALADKQGIQHWKAKALRFLGVVYVFRRQPDLARQYLERSLEQQRSVGDRRLEARTRANLGEVYELLGDAEVAVKCFEAALALSRGAADRVPEASAFFGLARASGRMNALDAARAHIESALQVVDSLRTEVERRDLRTSYFASVHQYHQFYIDVLMRLNSRRPSADLAATAFEASERARARSLLENLTVAGVDLRTGADAELLERERELKNAFDDWSRRQRQLSAQANETEANRLAEEYRSLELRYNQLQSEIRSTSPRYAALARPQPLTLEQVQKELLDPGTLLLEYALGEERSYLWAVSRDGYATYELPSRAEIERTAQRVYDHVTARLSATGTQRDRRRHRERADEEYWKEARHLSLMLLGPVASTISGKRLLVVADGALQYLPFAALPSPRNGDERVPLVLEHEIVSLPSASVAAAIRRETKDRKPLAGTVAVFADPVFESDDPRLHAGRGAAGRHIARAGLTRDGTVNIPRLAATRQEADAIIMAASPGTAFTALDFDANRATAMGPELAKYRILHFATHGVFNSDQPGLGGLILSMFDRRGDPQDGFLRLHDIYNLSLPAELVVLSACNTALGKAVRGEGLVGIVRGFMYAGAKRVVASHWKVDDEATAALMGRFYVEMFQNNRTPAAALREAQLAIRAHERWQSPFYWASFVLQGEWE